MNGIRLWLGVNRFEPIDERPIELHTVGPQVEAEQIAQLRELKQKRSPGKLEAAISAVRRAAEAGENTMPALIEAAKQRATVGELVRSLADVYGRYDPVV